MKNDQETFERIHAAMAIRDYYVACTLIREKIAAQKYDELLRAQRFLMSMFGVRCELHLTYPQEGAMKLLLIPVDNNGQWSMSLVPGEELHFELQDRQK